MIAEGSAQTLGHGYRSLHTAFRLWPCPQIFCEVCESGKRVALPTGPA